jgi:hypothetical protein
MTWPDLPDDEHVRTPGTRDHAANVNAFTVASADRQWFHWPGTSPPATSGNLRPLSLELVPNYTETAAASSQRRERASQIAKERIDSDRDFRDREIEVVTVSRPSAR